MRDFDENDFPLAYLITFRCYGTWLHGDDRGSFRRNSKVIQGVVRIPPRPGLKQAEAEQLRHNPMRLNKRQRLVVDKAVRDVACTGNTYSEQSMLEAIMRTLWSQQ